MKEYMMVTGCEILDNDWVEITMQPLSIVKNKKVGLMDLASGDMSALLSAIPQKPHKTKVYMKVESWGSMQLKIGRHVSLELLPDDITGGTK